MEASSNIMRAGQANQTDSTNGEPPGIMQQGIQPTPTITPEKIACVMADVQRQIDGLQLYLMELGLAKTRVMLLEKQGWAHRHRDVRPATVMLREDTGTELT
jgi:hypothetical protein